MPRYEIFRRTREGGEACPRRARVPSGDGEEELVEVMHAVGDADAEAHA